MDKELTLEELLKISKKAIDKANKDLGFVKPLTEAREFKMAPYDPEKDIKLVEFSPREWGIKGSPTSEQVDEILSNIITTTDKDPKKKIKEAFLKLKKILGPELTSTGVPLGTKAEDGDIHERFASLQLKSVFYTIFHENQPTTAGKIFESLMARIVGGYQSNNDDSLIEDLRDAEGNYISLKAIDRTTDITGSGINLALGILAAEKYATKTAVEGEAANKSGPGVIYLVCVKDLQTKPLYFKAFSFKIDRSNFFNFLLKKPRLSKAEIEEAKDKLLKAHVKTYRKEILAYAAQQDQQNAAQQDQQNNNPGVQTEGLLFEETDEEKEAKRKEGKRIAKLIELNDKRLKEAAEEYATKYLSWNKSSDVFSHIYPYYHNLCSNAISKAQSTVFEFATAITNPDKTPGIKIDKKSMLEILVNPTEEGYKGLFPSFESSKDLFKPNSINLDLYKKIASDFQEFKYNEKNFARYVETDPENRRLLSMDVRGAKLTDEDTQKILDIIRENGPKYKKIFTEFMNDKYVTDFFKFLDIFIETTDRIRYANKPPEEKAIPALQGFTDPVNEFFSILAGNEEKYSNARSAYNQIEFDRLNRVVPLEERLLLEAVSETSMSITIQNAQALASGLQADYDDNYEPVVVDTGLIYQTGVEEEKSLKNLMEALFRTHHETRQRYIQWFGYKDIGGLTGAVSSLQKEKDILDDMYKIAEKQQQNSKKAENSAESTQSANLGESKKYKKQLLTDSFFDDIKKMIL